MKILSPWFALKIRNATEGSKKAVLYLDITPAEELFLEDEDIMARGRIVLAENGQRGQEDTAL